MPNETFNRSGSGWVTWPIPEHVTLLRNVEIRGGGSPGVAAGLVTGQIDVKPTDALIMYLGEAGSDTGGLAGGAGGSAGVIGAHTFVGAGGGGGDGTGSGNHGGSGGGSPTAIWLRDTSKPGNLGRLLAVAGGAGGTSGASGSGGRGGAANGEDGKKGTTNSGAGGFTAATGGRQNQGGKGGISGAGSAHDGANASTAKLGKAGNGRNGVAGGGGGGGGYYGGGGGQGGVSGQAPDGGGAGGSNYTGGMHSGAQSIQGSGGAGDGQVQFFWQPENGNTPPTPPSSVKVNGKPEQPGMASGSSTSATISASVFDADGNKVRLYAEWSTNRNHNNAKKGHGDYVEIKSKPERATINLTHLTSGTHYWVRLWSEDSKGLRSLSYRSLDFWTNRNPSAPTLTSPPNYMQFPATATVDFSWKYNDADGSHQTAFALRYRVAGTPSADPRPWHWVGGSKKRVITPLTTWQIGGTTFLANYTYEWQVRTRDTFLKWSPWAPIRTFSTVANTTAPELDEPANGASVESDVDFAFTWRHVNWRNGQVQYTADLRFRVHDPAIHDEDAVWNEFLGDPVIPGSETSWMIPAQYDDGGGLQTTFIAGVTYDWQARTYSGVDATNVSQWSESNTFSAVPLAGSGLSDDNPVVQIAAGPLGCGNNRVMVMERGGRRMIGEITPIATVEWTRVRDDISSCNVSTAQFGDDCGELLSSLRSWQHELVVFRDGERVWEGPITRVGYFTDHVEIEAKDVMTYVYRRVMRVGYNDTYFKTHGVVASSGRRTVVDRATIITQNALGYDDPNVLQYLTRIDAADDAPQARSIAAYQKTAWEEIDDLAATAGLDYTVIGRRIVYNDVHNAIGKLPLMTAGDFSADPVVTEYGMSMANVFFVASDQGQWGVAYPLLPSEVEANGTEYLSPDQQTGDNPVPPWNFNTLFGAADLGISVERTTDHVPVGEYAVKAVTGPTDRYTELVTLVNDLTVGLTYTFSSLVWIPSGSPSVAADAVFAGVGAFVTQRDKWVEVSTTFQAYSTSMYMAFQTEASATGGTYYFDTSSLKLEAQGAFADDDHEHPLYYPFVEQLASAYGESAEDRRKTVRADKVASVSLKLSDQAGKSIQNRWPSPVVVRVPDNSALSPDLQIGINQLVPGVWIPLMAKDTLRDVTQWQKLDSVTVRQEGDTPETISVVLAPAPLNRQDDPDNGSGSLDDGESI